MDWQKLLSAMVPVAGGVIGGVSGHPQQGAAFMHGFQQSDQLMWQRRMQEEEANRRRAALEAEQQNRADDNQRLDTQARLNRLTQALSQMTAATNQQAEYATDPTQAENALLSRSSQLESSYELPPSSLSGYVPPMAPIISQKKITRAKAKVAEFKSLYGDRLGEVADALTVHEGEFAGTKLADLLSMAQMEPPPKVSPKAPNRNLQSKEVMRGGKRAFANFEPDTGKYFDVASGQEVSDISPIAPVSAGGGQPGQLPPATQRRVDAKSKGFDTQPVVKTVQKQAEAVSFANSLDPNTTNPADDQALIYAFAKAMDPDSVVREGEYATVQKYAQSWAETFGFNAARVFTNTSFLTPQARKNMKATIQKKYQAGKAQYDNVRKSFASQIDKITGQPGSGEEWLVDYGGAFPGDPASAPPAPVDARTPAPSSAKNAAKVGERRLINGVLAEWDGKGWMAVQP